MDETKNRGPIHERSQTAIARATDICDLSWIGPQVVMTVCVDDVYLFTWIKALDPDPRSAMKTYPQPLTAQTGRTQVLG